MHLFTPPYPSLSSGSPCGRALPLACCHCRTQHPATRPHPAPWALITPTPDPGPTTIARPFTRPTPSLPSVTPVHVVCSPPHPSRPRGRVPRLGHLTAFNQPPRYTIGCSPARGRVGLVCPLSLCQCQHPGLSFSCRGFFIRGVIRQPRPLSTTPRFRRYPERYWGGTGQYQQAVPGDTRRYPPPQRAVLARYRVVRRYRPGLTFSPVPGGRYPVPGQKMGDTGAIRGAGTA